MTLDIFTRDHFPRCTLYPLFIWLVHDEYSARTHCFFLGPIFCLKALGTYWQPLCLNLTAVVSSCYSPCFRRVSPSYLWTWKKPRHHHHHRHTLYDDWMDGVLPPALKIQIYAPDIRARQIYAPDEHVPCTLLLFYTCMHNIKGSIGRIQAITIGDNEVHSNWVTKPYKKQRSKDECGIWAWI